MPTLKRLGWSLLAVVFATTSVRAAPAGRPQLTNPLFSNVTLVNHLPDAGGISASFDPNRPYMYLSTVHGIDVYDIRKPWRPILVGAVPMVLYQNENVNLGTAATRPDGTTFVLVGTDIVGALTPTAPRRSAVGPDGGYVKHLYVIDVTDPASPFIRSDLAVSTYTHTISCLDVSCRYAYTAGTLNRFSVIELGDLDHPREVRIIKDGWGWHDWLVDSAGVIWKSGDQGTAAYQIGDPLNPEVLNSTDASALQGRGWNDFIHHNSDRPYAYRFPAGTELPNAEPSVFRGNVLLVTEEDQKTGRCPDFGAFQTWHVPSLKAGDTPSNKPGTGTIHPLDRWTTELNVGAYCSAHYFDFHQAGFIVQAWYMHGIRVLDVRDARDIKQVGYFIAYGQEAWSAYWVPVRDESGRVVAGPQGDALRSTLVYSVDAVRGLDILRVELPAAPPAEVEPVAAPVLSNLFEPPAIGSNVAAPGFVCRIRRE